MKSVYLSLIGILFLVGSSFTNPLNAQRNCGATEYLEMQMQQDPKRAFKMQQIEEQTRHFLQNSQGRAIDGVITIPVVVHIVYNNATENISDAQIQSQLDVINADFRRTNSDADNIWSQAADAEIEFCMATVDPSGNPTNGITRTSTTRTSFSTNDDMKFDSRGGKDAWPRDDYLNMWVCDISGGILGYAQFPGGSAATDGVVMDYQYFGTIGTATAPFDLGRTTTHEIGHWLNLRHIWGDGGCGVDDFVTDTPESDAPNYSCALGHVSCGSTDMVQNYMDYSDDACMNLYTFGQKARMRALFDNGGARESLLSSGGCGTPAPPSCDDGIQNGNETGVDCGGPDCDACPPCTDVVVSILTDNYPGETTWQITDAGGAVVASGGPYGSTGTLFTSTECLVDGCYDFTIFDSYGDGICCAYGTGEYTVTVNGQVVASGGEFGASETTNFCVSDATAPTCNDGIQNGDETGVDCGGSDCPACPTCDDGIQNGDETGIDCGGSDCPACPTCDDGIQNGDETGVDCGGSDCPACPTCNDGIQNGNETGVDCGGSDCPA
ncbi:MAG: zinc metalloprotease, partial [Bacteroidota bacterium]